MQIELSATGSAQKGIDYRLSPESPVTIPPGATSYPVQITPIADSLVEGTEFAIFAIVPETAYTVKTQSPPAVKILDADTATKPSVTIAAIDGDAAEHDNDYGTIRFFRSGDADYDLDVAFSGTSSSRYALSAPNRAETAFEPVYSPIRIFAGETSRTVRLVPNYNVKDMFNPSLNVQFDVLSASNPSKYDVGSPSSANVVIRFDPLVYVSIVGVVDGSEWGSAPAIVKTRLQPDPSWSIGLEYAFSGSAADRVDFVSGNYSRYSPIGEPGIYLFPIDDALIEGTKDVTLTFLPGDRYKIVGPASAALHIYDNDTLAHPVVGFDRPSASVTEGGESAIVHLVRSDADSGADLAVFSQIGGDAVRDKDCQLLAAGRGETGFFPVGDQIAIFAGDTSRTLKIVPIDDKLIEPVKHMTLQLKSGPGYDLSDAKNLSVAILDNEPRAVVEVVSDGNAAESHQMSAYFRFSSDSKAALAEGTIPINFRLTGTAANGIDYDEVPLTIDYGLFSGKREIEIRPNNDLIPEGTENVVLTLAAGWGYTTDTRNAASLDIFDNDRDHPTSVGMTKLGSVAVEGRTEDFIRLTRSEGSVDADLDLNFSISGDAQIDSTYLPFGRTDYDYAILAAARGETGFWPLNQDVDRYRRFDAPIAIYRGESHRDLKIIAYVEQVFEPDEQATIALSPVDGVYTVDSPSSATMIIRDLDHHPDTPEVRLVIAFYRYFFDRYPESPRVLDYWIGRFAQIRDRKFDVRMSVLGLYREFMKAGGYQSFPYPGTEVNQRYINAAYGAFLRRAPDADESADATNRPGSGREETLHFIEGSAEFRDFIETQFPQEPGENLSNYTNRGYDFLLERVADLGGLADWKGWLNLNADKRSVSVFLAYTLIDTPEFRSKAMTGAAKADRVLRFFLDRFPTPAEMAFWGDKLDEGSLTLQKMCEQLGNTPEFDAVLERYFPGWGVKSAEAFAVHNAVDARDWTMYP